MRGMFGTADLETLAARQSEREMRRFTLARFKLGDLDGQDKRRAKLACPVPKCPRSTRDGGPCKKHWRHRPAWLAEHGEQP